MKKRLILPALGVVLSVSLLSACSTPPTLDPDAATVNGKHIKLRDVEEALRSLQKADTIAEAAEAQSVGQEPPAPRSDATYGTDEGVQLLTNLIVLELLDQEATKLGVTPSTGGLGEAERQAALILHGTAPEDLNDRPAAIVARVRKGMGAVVALRESLIADPLDDAALQAKYDELRAAGTLPVEVCVSHILVATEAEAIAAKAEINAGKSFEEVATARSTDTGSAAQGGKLRQQDGSCFLGDGLVPEFVEGARTTTPGVTSDPVQSQFGFHLIKPETSVGPVSFDNHKAALQQQSEAERAQPYDSLVAAAAAAAKITIDKRFGSWDPKQGVIPPNAVPSGG